MEIILDSNENCFLCLQTIRKDGENKLCLGNICRFLQINISDVLLEGLKEGDKDIDTFNYNLLQNMKCIFSVNLCNSCYGVAGKLSSIIHDLEVAHLQVNYYSEVFHKILEKADIKSAATKKTGHTETATADSRMVEYLRKEAKQKCFARNNRALATTSRLPLVRLNKLTKETVTTMTNKNATVDSLTPVLVSALNDVGVGILESLKREENHDMSFTNSDPQVDPISAGSSNNITSNQLTFSEDHQLMSCSESFTMGYPELERIDVEDWIHCPNNQESTESQTLEDPLSCNDGNDDGIAGERENCNESFVMPQIMQEDGYITKKRKTDREKHPNERGPANCVVAEGNKIKSSSRTAETSKDQLACNHCKRRFPRARNLERHMTSIHPEQIFLSYKPAHISAPKFYDSCRKILQSETVGYSDKSQKVVPVKCSYCTEIQTYKQNYVRHLVSSHGKVIGEKIRTFEHDKAQRPQCNQCNSTFPRARSLRLHMISHHPDQIFLCYKPAHISASDFREDCRQIFQKETVMFGRKKKRVVPLQCANCTEIHQYKQYYLKHLVYSHTKIMGEKIKTFANAESEIISGDPLSADACEDLQVAKSESCSINQQPPIVDKSTFIEESTNNTSTTSQSEGRFACSHCNTRFLRKINLHFHMITAHPEQLFLYVKPAHRSESNFADSCRKVLESETLGYSNSSQKTVPRQCAYCTEMRRYKRDYVRHLVYSHTKIMSEKIRAFEEKEPPVGATAIPPTSNYYCGVQPESDLAKKRTADRGNSSQVVFAENDNPNYPVVVRVEEVDQISCPTQDTCTETLTVGDWSNVQVEGMMIKTEDYSESSSNCGPILIDPLSVDEFHN